MMKVYSGIDIFEKVLPKKFYGLRAGVLIHPASVNRKLVYTKDVFLKSKKNSN